MKLLIDARNLGSRPSGVGMYAYNFIIGFLKFQDIELHVIVDEIKSNEIIRLNSEKNIKVHAYGKCINKSILVFEYFRYVKKMIKMVHPDIFWEVNNLAPVKLKNPYGKYVITIHDIFPLTLPEYYRKIYPSYFWLGVNRTINCCDAIIYNSETTKRAVESYFTKAKNKKNFVSYIIIHSLKGKCVGAQRSEGFLYVGNLEKRKGTDILLEAYDRYVENGGKRELHIAGKVCEEDIKEQLEDKLKKNDKLKYLGYVSESERASCYNGCECFVFPSRAEGFGMPVIEALSCGKNVITSNLDIFKEITNGYVEQFELDEDRNIACDNLANSLLEYDTRDKAQDCTEIVQKYSESKLAPQLYYFLKELM